MKYKNSFISLCIHSINYVFLRNEYIRSQIPNKLRNMYRGATLEPKTLVFKKIEFIPYYSLKSTYVLICVVLKENYFSELIYLITIVIWYIFVYKKEPFWSQIIMPTLQQWRWIRCSKMSPFIYLGDVYQKNTYH